MSRPILPPAGFSRTCARLFLCAVFVLGSLPCLAPHVLAQTTGLAAETTAETARPAETPAARDSGPGQALPAQENAAMESPAQKGTGQDAPDNTAAKAEVGTSGARDKVEAKESASESSQGTDKGEAAKGPYSPEAMALWPDVDGFVTSRFGERRGSTVPLLSDTPMRPRFHSGLDVRGHLGWPVRTLKDGKVLHAGMAGSAGLTVKIAQTDGKTVSYAHLGKVLVKKGDRVRQGQHIGEVGCTGRTSGAHVHITVRNSKGQRTDPRKEISGLWELYDPPLEDLKSPVRAQACVRRGYNKRLAGQKQYLRMRKALIDSGAYKIPDIEPWGNRP